MSLFKRAAQRSKDSDDQLSESESTKKASQPASRRPADTAFKQQRLQAWQPTFAPTTILPALFLIAVICAPIGGILIWGASNVSDISFDYTECDKLTAATSPGNLQFSDLPSDRYSYKLRAQDAQAFQIIVAPSYALLDNSGNSSVTDVSQKRECYIQFDIPANLPRPVLFYYRLTNFFQNHRRYVKSFHSDQFRGDPIDAVTLDGGDCHPLGMLNDKAIYPCGLIANSMFNDTFSSARRLDTSGEASSIPMTYEFSAKGIAWPGERRKYTNVPRYNLSDIVPPPNWALRFPNYTAENLPNLQEDERFQNWMRTSGLPTFPKLYGRNDTADMPQGRYEIIIGLNYPVRIFNGRKEIVLTNASWVGGKNVFLGWLYVGVSGLFFVLAVFGTIQHLVKPRRIGDLSLLSWNRPAK